MENKWIIDNGDETLYDDYEDAYQACIETEIIYYNKAMEYLSEHDWSLRESTEIASDLGYELKTINSEMLATLHLQDELIKCIKEIEVENQI